MADRIKVLYFSAWYPHRYDAMSGLFVRKHAQAVARLCDVCVLYLHADEEANDFEIVEQETDGVKEIYVYYPFVDRGLFRQATKAINYARAFHKGYKRVEETFGRPNVTQANVLTRSGVLSWLLCKKYGIPYVVVEHWSRYLPQNFNYKGFFRKRLTEKVVREASAVMAVSAHLRDAMREHGLDNDNFGLINNVVDDIFYRTERVAHSGPFRFLHVSCFDERPKNVCGILRAFKKVLDIRQDVALTLVGTGKDWETATEYAKELGLTPNNVIFTGEKKPKEVCQYMAESDCLVMFSRYETHGVVISEAWASGLPVISTEVGIVPDVMTDENGIRVKNDDVEDLAEKMLWMIENRHRYESDTIKRLAEKYNQTNVGIYLADIYSRTGQTTAK
ncbi:MAG: glycosyltransferase [Bacteroidales bacterium]|nr:glycosyltransferase [Bacteroidales bacterium]